ncbi:MAG: hypothetical protein ABL857_08150 [Rickettsiales bacterium]
MDTNKEQSKPDECNVSQAGSKIKNHQQAKKDKLAAALRDNLRRRKAVILPADAEEGED